ncbi:MAG: hypothetical protein GF341_00590 [candidate division Zixibacteria bacterium]|nr:hypothetical protein [candidate division Zixibacteria bacterium]
MAQQLDTFLELDLMHSELDEMFLRHQEGLIAGRLSDALQRLDRFERLLLLHMRHEEQQLLPAFEAQRSQQDEPPGLPAEVYVLEHKKICERLSEIKQPLVELQEQGQPSPRDLIAMLDLECGFKQLLDHHNRREHNLLYPDSDKLISEDKRMAMLEQCRTEWAEARDH